MAHRWVLWSQRPGVIAYTVGVDLVAAVAALLVVATSTAPIQGEWGRFAVLLVCSVAHLRASRGLERQHRAVSSGPHVDLNSIWIVAAILVLHPALTVALICVLRLDRWFLARRPPFRYLLSTAAHVLSAALALVTLRLLGGTQVTADWYGSTAEVAAVMGAGIVYFAVQTVTIAVAIALAGGGRDWTALLGSTETNMREAATVCLGFFAALALARAPLLLLAMVPVALVVHRTVLVRQLQAAVDQDSKTGLLNAGGWRRRADRELARAVRGGQHLGLLVIDLDHFKRVNDTHGHLAGDDVLRAIAGVLTAQTRPYDVVGRFGGEEFVVLLPGSDPDATAAAAERIRSAVAALAVPVEQSVAGTVVVDGLSASIGAGCYPESAGTMDTLLGRADSALLAAKEGGRNRVRFVRGAAPIG